MDGRLGSGDRPGATPRAAVSGNPTPFVGRRRELHALLERLAGPPTVGPTFVAGEPGIGKTRMLAALAERAESDGWQVAWGRSWTEPDAPPYWTWAQVARHLRGAAGGTNLARLVLPDVDEADDVERFASFDATVTMVRKAAIERPLLVLLEDLHAADLPSLMLTRFVAQQSGDSRVRLVGTYRPAQLVERPEALLHVDAMRQVGKELILDGLDADAVATLVGDPEQAGAVRAVTGGNPLFVEQVIRSARGVGSTAVPRPTGVAAMAEPTTFALRALLRARIGDLAPEPNAALQALAVLGGAASTEHLAHVLDARPADVERALDDLATAGMIRSGTTGIHECVHSLVAEASAPETAVRLHRRAAALVEEDPERLGQLAHHLLRSGPEHRDAAVRACHLAARAATVATAHEQAVLHLEQALAALDDVDETREPAVPELTRLDVLLALGRAQRLADQIAEADATFDAAHALADRLGDADGLALAALRGGIQYYFVADRSASRIEPCRQALERLPEGDTPLRARLMADIAARLSLGVDLDAGRATADDAVAMARRLGDPVALGHALLAQQVADPGPATLARRLSTAREILTLARQAGEPTLTVQGRFLLLGALLEQGDLRPLEAELATDRAAADSGLDELADRTRARFGHWFGCTRALLDGDAERAEEIANRGLTVALERGETHALRVFGGQIGVVRWLQGRDLELEPLYEQQRQLRPREAAWLAVLARVWATNDRPDVARAALADLQQADPIPPLHYLVATTLAAEAAALVGDEALVATYWERLLPFGDRFVPVNMGAAAWGTVARPLGLLAARLHRQDEAVAYLERAVAVCARLRARPWLVQAQLDLAVLLRRRGGRAAERRVRELVTEASAIAAELGLTRFVDRAASLSLTASRAPFAGEVPVGEGAGRPSIAVLGTFEVTSADGRVAVWTSRKARELVKILVSRRGAPVHREVLMDLLWPDTEPALLGNRLSVALSTVRGALDPDRKLPTGALVTAERDAVRLRIDRVDVDVERFLDLARRAMQHDESGAPDAGALLKAASRLHNGPALPDEPYAPWASALQSEVQLAHLGVLRRLADRAAASGDDLVAVDLLRQLVDADPYDEVVHDRLVAVLVRIGAVVLANQERSRYQAVTAPAPT